MQARERTLQLPGFLVSYNNMERTGSEKERAKWEKEECEGRQDISCVSVIFKQEGLLQNSGVLFCLKGKAAFKNCGLNSPGAVQLTYNNIE